MNCQQHAHRPAVAPDHQRQAGQADEEQERNEAAIHRPLRRIAVVGMASWVMAEFVRVFHGVSTNEAQDTVDALVERKTPLIWEVEGMKRVLDASMGAKDQVLLFLHHSIAWVAAADLQKWVEYKNTTQFRDNVLAQLHKARFIEFDTNGDRARISPTGAADVELRLLKT